MANFYLLSEKFDAERHASFATATTLVMVGGADCRMRPGDVMKSVTDLFSQGRTLDGAEPAGYEIGQWKGRCMCEDEAESPVDGETYFAWVSTNFWDYDPNLVFYTKAEFAELFVDCCRNYVADNPDRRQEFVQALAANGMTL
jgi:hypothetical protein